jgi:DNA-binding transcriptional MerR regulator
MRAVLGQARQRQLDTFGDLLRVRPDEPYTATLERAWTSITGSDGRPYLQMFGQLREDAGQQLWPDFRRTATTDWLGPLQDGLRSIGRPELATLLLAVIRGLLMDLDATADTTRTNLAFHDFLAALEQLRSAAPHRARGGFVQDIDPGLSTGEVARMLGVAAVTVRSWERRYGIGPTSRPQGRHRRYYRDDIAELSGMCRLTAQGVAPAEAARLALNGTGVSEASSASAMPCDTASGTTVAAGKVDAPSRGLVRAAVRMDVDVVEEILSASLSRSGVITTWETLAAPALRAVGRQWAGAQGRYVEVEHLLSGAISRCLCRAVPAPLPRADADTPRRSVVLAGAPTDLHTLPMDALHAALAQIKVPVLALGAAVPAAALLSVLQRCDAASVVVWSQQRSTADRRQLVELSTFDRGVAGARRTPRVHPAGPGWHAQSLPAGIVPLTDLRSAVAILSKP